MNALNKGLAGLMFAGLTLAISACLQATAATPAQVVRTISVAEKPDGAGDSCVIDATKDQRVNFTDDGFDCENDQMSYFKLDNVRSAVEIRLESRACDDEGGWVFVLKTYIDPISTPWISIESLRGRPEGDIITRGVRLVHPYSGGENIQGKLSCVRVNVSDLP